MIKFIIGLVVGLLLGTFCGIFTAAMCTVAADADEWEEKHGKYR